MGYCTRDDVFNLAIPAKAFVVRAQPVDPEEVDDATGIIRLRAHGLSTDDLVTLEVTSGGGLPTDLVAFTAYPVEPISFDLIRLRDPGTGDPITSYADVGSGWGVAVDLMRRLDLHIVAAAARIDEHLTAHATPLVAPYPMQVREVSARLAGRRMLTTLQFDNAAYRISADQLIATADQDEAQLRRWLAGKPVSPRPTDQSTVPDNGARARSSRKPANWHTGRL